MSPGSALLSQPTLVSQQRPRLLAPGIPGQVGVASRDRVQQVEEGQRGPKLVPPVGTGNQYVGMYVAVAAFEDHKPLKPPVRAEQFGLTAPPPDLIHPVRKRPDKGPHLILRCRLDEPGGNPERGCMTEVRLNGEKDRVSSQPGQIASRLVTQRRLPVGG